METALVAAPSYGAAIEANARSDERRGIAPVPAEHLVLSGGGKWGSFGAGFLHALPDRPVYRVVTGVSTGALQASFVFVGDQPVPAGRAAIYTAANDLALGADDPLPGAGRRFIDDLPRAYTVTRSETVILQKGGLVTAARKGAAGDFAPLRRRLELLLDRDMIARIAAAGDEGRGLYVGVIDVDSGDAYAVDMVDLARRASDGSTDFRTAQSCYIDVLIASSSEPLQARPVFFNDAGQPGLNPHMYMDGGARFGVFLEEVLDEDGNPALAERAPRMDTTMVVNGEMGVPAYTADSPAKWGEQWDLLQLAGRSKDILVDQVYHFSVDRVVRYGGGRGAVRLATARGYAGHHYPGSDGLTCAEWRGKEAGIAFPPMFMKCLIDFGRWKATQPGAYDIVKDAPSTVSAAGVLPGGK
ncbi:MAG TPA: patatin-like phospholipase family protein [Novosphingobium sp.]|nr:patatin-like phospholipase family protein [Novosphingobium sp.]